jgi:hypothetical protein
VELPRLLRLLSDSTGPGQSSNFKGVGRMLGRATIILVVAGAAATFAAGAAAARLSLELQRIENLESLEDPLISAWWLAPRSQQPS